MEKCRSLSKLIPNKSGFSLVELLMVLGILGVVAAGTSAHLLTQVKSHQKHGSKANLIQTSDLLAKALGSSRSGGRLCRDILEPVTTFTNSGETDVRLNFGGSEAYSSSGQESKIPGISAFTINKLYLADKVSLAPQRPNTFLTSLYIVGDIGASDNSMRTKPRNIATIVVKVDSSNNIVECNASSPTDTPIETCSGMYGMTVRNGRCEQALNLDNNFNLTTCPVGTRFIMGACLPTPSGCANGQIARGFDLGITQGCAEPPLNPAVGVATLGVPPPVENQPNQVPQREVANVDPLVPITTNTIPPSTNPTSPPAECSVDGETMDTVNYSLCQLDPECQARTIGVTSTNCTSSQPTAYVPPPANSTTPSNAPPNDGSCQCSDARIANGDYCSYCSQNVNVGYAFVDYAYAVNQCVNGNLVPVANASFDPYGECANGYAPTYRNGNNYRQYGGYDRPAIQ